MGGALSRWRAWGAQQEQQLQQGQGQGHQQQGQQQHQGQQQGQQAAPHPLRRTPAPDWTTFLDDDNNGVAPAGAGDPWVREASLRSGLLDVCTVHCMVGWGSGSLSGARTANYTLLDLQQRGTATW
jgi:hypothetical protein